MRKNIKIINIINLVVSVMLLILQNLPNAVKLTSCPHESVNKTISNAPYLTLLPNWLNWTFLISGLISVLTILCMVFNLVSLINDKKAISVTNVVVTSIVFVGNLMFVILMRNSLTAHMIIISLLLLAQIALLSAKFVNIKRSI